MTAKHDNLSSADNAAIAKTMAALDTISTSWAMSFDKLGAVAGMASQKVAADRLVAFVKHAFAEGLYQWRKSHYEAPADETKHLKRD